MALTPTLTLWEVESKNASPEELEKGMSKAAQQLGAFSRAGGQVLFGTDVAYIEQFDTSEEFKWMSCRNEFSGDSCLAHHEPRPALRLRNSQRTIAKGLDADLVVLGADPAQNTSAFSKVRYTIRRGEVIYAEK